MLLDLHLLFIDVYQRVCVYACVCSGCLLATELLFSEVDLFISKITIAHLFFRTVRAESLVSPATTKQFLLCGEVYGLLK